jgi:hypothetical protein
MVSAVARKARAERHSDTPSTSLVTATAGAEGDFARAENGRPLRQRPNSFLADFLHYIDMARKHAGRELTAAELSRVFALATEGLEWEVAA